MDEVEYAHMIKMRSLRFNKFSKIVDTAMNGSDEDRYVLVDALDTLLQCNLIDDKTIQQFLFAVDLDSDIGIFRHTVTVDEKDYKHYQEWIDNKESE
jgi:hypothetical protein